MPTRSSGCATCRKRKIRCDETRPGCKRCETHGVPCPGYRTELPGGVEFRDQTRVTASRAESQYKAKEARHNPRTDFAWKVTTKAAAEQAAAVWPTPESSNGPEDLSSWGTPIAEDGVSEQSLVLAKDRVTTKNGQAKSNVPVQILSPSLERARLYNEFITSYLPQVRGGAQNGHFSFFQAIATKRTEQPALQQGLDALSLVQIGSLQKDQAILKEAVHHYGNALHSLTRSLQRSQDLYNDDALAAVTVMATCELYEEIAKMSDGWAKHVQGSHQLLAMRGPQSLKSDLALLLYTNMRHGSLIHALIRRKAPFMAAPEWREVAFRVPGMAQDSVVAFYDSAIQIPGVLERHDELDLSSPTALQDIDGVLADSTRLEVNLRKWFVDWQAKGSTEFGKGRICELRPIEEFPTFCSLCSDRTFDQAYMFPDFLVAYMHSLYWMVMHYLRTNTQMLQKHRHRLVMDWYPEEEEIVREAELLGYILNVCQCIPFHVEPVSSSTGSIGIFLPLRCAGNYFTSQGHWQWLRWIGNVRNSVFVRGLVPPKIQHKQSGKVSPGP